MRDILEQLEQLNESTGLAGRKVGDTFKNAEGATLTFQELKFFPEEGKYDPGFLIGISSFVSHWRFPFF